MWAVDWAVCSVKLGPAAAMGGGANWFVSG